LASGTRCRKIEANHPPPKKLSQINVLGNNKQTTSGKNISNSSNIITPLEESIRLNKLKKIQDTNTQITLTEDFYDSRSRDEDMPYPDSDSDTITVNTNKNKKKRKLHN
jgi:hypothetical protein